MRSQTSHCGVKIEIIFSLWLLLKGQSGEILFCGERIYIMKENIWIIKSGFTKPKILTPCSVMHTAESILSNFVIEYLGNIKTEFENT